MAAFGGPLPKDHILPVPLAACSPGANCLEKEVPQPAAFGEACACETVGFYGRLRRKPAVKPYGRQLPHSRIPRIQACGLARPWATRLISRLLHCASRPIGPGDVASQVIGLLTCWLIQGLVQ